MTTCKFIMKCRHCGEEYSDTGGGPEAALAGLMYAVHGITFPEKYMGIPPDMHGIHSCEGEKFMGVSDLIGVRTKS